MRRADKVYHLLLATKTTRGPLSRKVDAASRRVTFQPSITGLHSLIRLEFTILLVVEQSSNFRYAMLSSKRDRIKAATVEVPIAPRTRNSEAALRRFDATRPS